MPPPASPPKKRGAPIGNQNARKHGLTPRYTALYKSPKMAAINLTAEIELLRHHIADISSATSQIPSPAEKLETLRLLTLAATALARLVRAQVLVFTTDAHYISAGSSLDQYLAQLTGLLPAPGSPPPSPHQE